MREAFATTVLILLFYSIVLPQANQPSTAVPDFSGTWELDFTGSDLGPYSEDISKRILVIEHKDPVVKLTWTTTRLGRETSFTEVLYSDKRKEDNGTSGSGEFNINSTRSRTFLQKRTLVREFLFTPGLTGNARRLDRIRYSLTDHDKKLTILTLWTRISPIDRNTPTPPRPTISGPPNRQVFRKK